MTAFDVLERQLQDAAAGRRRRRRGGRPLAVLALAAAVLAAFVLLDRGGAPPSPPADEREVTAPPVAFLSPDPDKIVYVRVTSIATEQGVTRERAVVEEWHRGNESRKLDRWTDEDGQDWAVESVIDAEGVMRRIDETGGYGVFRKTEDTKTTIEQQQAGYLADFQRRAEQGTLDPTSSPDLTL